MWHQERFGSSERKIDFKSAVSRVTRISTSLKEKNQEVLEKIGPDNPICQLLPIMGNKCCSGMGKEGKTKEVVKDRKLKTAVWYSTKSYVKDGV